MQPDASVVIIQSKRGLAWPDLADLWQGRELLYFLAWRDIQVRYRQTLLGVAWTLLQPLAGMVVFTFFFGRLAGLEHAIQGVPYSLYVLAGLLPWSFFTTSVANSGASIVSSAQLITKVYFPRLLVPFASILAAAFDFAISTALLIGAMALHRRVPTASALLAPFLFLAIMLASAGIGAMVACLTALYRDFRHVVPFVLQLWLFVTPVIYPEGAIPERWRWLLTINPLGGLIAAFRASILGLPIDAASALTSACAAVGLFLFGVLYFSSMESRLSDVV